MLYHDILLDLLITKSNLYLLRTIYCTLGHSAACSDPSGLARGVCGHCLSPSITFFCLLTRVPYQNFSTLRIKDCLVLRPSLIRSIFGLVGGYEDDNDKNYKVHNQIKSFCTFWFFFLWVYFSNLVSWVCFCLFVCCVRLFVTLIMLKTRVCVSLGGVGEGVYVLSLITLLTIHILQLYRILSFNHNINTFVLKSFNTI